VAPFDLTQTDRLLSTTRAVRKRLDLDRPVEAEVITECLRLATYTPSAANTQMWRWLVVLDPAKREQIADIYRGLFYRDVHRSESAPDAEMSRMYTSAK
jgi:nitroreductase